MQLISDLKHMRLYSNKRKVYVPFNPSNKRKGATIKLLTKDIEDSISTVNLPYLYNPKLYRSYYMPRNVMAYVDSKGIVDQDEIEDEDEALIEATIHKASKRSVTIDTHGTPADKAELSSIFNEKNIKKWFSKLGKGDYKFNVTVYGFNSRHDLIKAIGTEVILRYSDVVFNSYCTPHEIFVLNRSAFKEIENEEIDYKMYCENEMISWVCMSCSRKCNRQLANYIGCGMSGQAKKIRDTKWDKQQDIHSDIGPALTVTALYKDLGDKGLAKLVRTGDYKMLAHYKADELVSYAKILASKGINKVGNSVLDIFEEQTLLESDGSHADVMRIFDDMNEKDQYFVTRDSLKYREMPERRVLYRHVERGEGILDLKGFVEVTKDAYALETPGDTASIIIGVHPNYRREGVGKQLMKTVFKELPKERPEITNLIWRADINNKASQKLAEQCGFKLIRKTKVQATYRYEIKKCKYLEDLDKDITDINKLTKKLKEFKIKEHAGYDVKIRPIKDIIRSNSGNEFDRARLAGLYLNKMAIYNLVAFLEFTDVYGAKDFYFFNIYGFGDKYFALDINYEWTNSADVDVILKKYVSFAKTGRIKTELDENIARVEAHYFESPSITHLEGKPFVSNNAYAYMTTYKSQLQETAEESKIAHIPVPRMSIYEQSGDAGYFGNSDYILSENMICFFNEANPAYDTRIKRYLYKQRIKTNKDLLDQYNRAKLLDPKIEKTFLKLEMYKGLNLYVDLSYYNGLFLANLNLVKDKGVDFYWDFMNRLLEDSPDMKRTYPYSAIFIPVSNDAWGVPAGGDLTDYRQTINPISVIMRLIKTNPMELKNKWKNKRVVFLGKKGYFTIDFNQFEYKNVARMKGFIDKLASGQDIDEEDGYDVGTDTDTKSAIGMNIVDKIEKSSGITIDNVSRLVKAGPESLGVQSIDRIPTMRIRDTMIVLPSTMQFGQKEEEQYTIGIGIFEPKSEYLTAATTHKNRSKIKMNVGYIYSIYDME